MSTRQSMTVLMAAALSAAILVPGLARAQSSPSLAEQVQQVQMQLQSAQQGTLSLLNRIDTLEQESRAQQGQIELL